MYVEEMHPNFDSTDKASKKLSEKGTPQEEVSETLSALEPISKEGNLDISDVLQNKKVSTEVFPGSVWSVDATKIPNFTESSFGKVLGTNREDIFRKVGEGSGKATDLTPEIDNNFNHLVFASEVKSPDGEKMEKRLKGSYRYTWGRDMLKNKGVEGFYNSSLLNFNPEFEEDVLDKSMELTRFFGTSIRAQMFLFPAMQKLSVKRREEYPDFRFLFGTITLSSDIPLEWQKKFVYLLQEATKDAGLFDPKSVSAKDPENEITFDDDERQELEGFFKGKNTIEEKLTHLREEFSASEDLKGIKYPILVDSYIRLVTEGGIQFGTAVKNPLRSANKGKVNIENPSIEVLMVVDLEKTSGKADQRNRDYGEKPINSPVPSLRDAFLEAAEKKQKAFLDQVLADLKEQGSDGAEALALAKRVVLKLVQDQLDKAAGILSLDDSPAEEALFLDKILTDLDKYSENNNEESYRIANLIISKLEEVPQPFKQLFKGKKQAYTAEKDLDVIDDCEIQTLSGGSKKLEIFNSIIGELKDLTVKSINGSTIAKFSGRCHIGFLEKAATEAFELLIAEDEAAQLEVKAFLANHDVKGIKDEDFGEGFRITPKEEEK